MSAPFWHELRRRHVFRVAAAYLVTVWVLLQLASIVLPTFGAPAWVLKVLIGVFVLFFPVAILLAWALELTPDGVRRTRPADSAEARPASATRQVGRRLDFGLIGILAVAVAILAWRLGTRPQAPGVLGPSPPAAPGQTTKSIAVLPFDNDSGDPQQRYFSDGLSENLIIALSKSPNLVVIGRNSSFQLRDTKLGSQDIGKKLGVAYLLEGSVSHDGSQVRVRAELVDAPTGRTLWSNFYDRPFAHVFELQDDITRSVTTALQAKLLGAGNPQADPTRPPSGSLDAFNAYLEGNFYAAGFSEESLRTGVGYYRKAIALDPGYGAAWAGLSAAWSRLAAGFLGGADRRQAFHNARVAVESALRLAPNLALAYVARGSGQLYTADWRGAEASLRRALELTPSNSEAKQLLAIVLGVQGRLEEALGYAREAVAASTLEPIAYYRLAQILVGLDRPREAEQALRKAISLQPGADVLHNELTTVEIMLGNPEAAISAAEAEPDPSWRATAEALAYAAAGEKARADQSLQTLISKHADVAAYQIAEVYALRGQPDEAFAWLDRAWKEQDPGSATVLMDPFLRRYRADPRFAAFCKKAGLPVPPRTGEP